MSLPFYVDSRCLIPRPETELLVQTVIDHCRSAYFENNPISILDIGTGSGNIAISLARNVPDAQVVALDVSGDALAVAAQNAELNQVASQIIFVEGDVATYSSPEKFDIIVSNPPYVTRQEFNQLAPEISKYEPRIALDGGEDGLYFYKIIGQKAESLLKSTGRLALEVGHQQAELVSQILLTHKFKAINRIHDFNQIERVVLARYDN